MARTSFTVITAPGAYAGALSTLPFTKVFTATCTSTGMQFVLTGAEVIIARHPATASSTHHMVLTSVDDPYGRSESITEGLSSGQFKLIGPMKKSGWMQTDGKMYLHSNSTKVQAVIIKVPGL